MTSTTVSRAPASGSATRKKSRKAPFPVELWRSDVGKKYVMAITGILLMGFVFFHTLGNLKMYLGPVHFDEYAEWLRELLVPFLPRTAALWIMRIGLIVAFALHILAAYSLTRVNIAASRGGHIGPSSRYKSRRDYIAANYASRTMRWSGIIVGLFLVWHLFDLSWTGTGYSYVRGDTYGNVADSLSRWPVALLYIVANIALAFHLFHGAWSLFQTMGWSNPRFNVWRRNFAIGFAAVVCIPNISFPIAVLAGVISQ
jgi:succinate dehydrogenase / fumarate reductase cytochrome b subunit